MTFRKIQKRYIIDHTKNVTLLEESGYEIELDIIKVAKDLYKVAADTVNSFVEFAFGSLFMPKCAFA